MQTLTIRYALRAYAFYFFGMAVLVPLTRPESWEQAVVAVLVAGSLGGTAVNVLLWIVGGETKIEPCPQPEGKRSASTGSLSR
jgi:hypothetical protein